MNNTIGIDSRINDAEEQRSELEDRMVEISAMEQNKQKRMKIKNEDSLRDLQDNNRCTSIRIIEVPEGKKRQDLSKYLKR